MPKISIDVFSGVIPLMPDHSLPKESSSNAVNARLTDSTIRPYYQPELSGVTPQGIGTSNGFSTFFKASYASDTVAWMVWQTINSPVGTTISLVESRYNDITAYDYPDTIASPVGGVLNVLLSGDGVSLSNGEYSSTETHRIVDNDPGAIATFNSTQQITSTVEVELNGTPTYAWVFVSGDAGVTIDNAAIANPTFSMSAAKPGTIDSSTTISAIWKVTATDATPDTGTREVEISATYLWDSTPFDFDGFLCVWTGCSMPYIGSAGMAELGAPVTILNDSQDGVTTSKITNVEFGEEEAVQLEVSHGATITCSVSTPMTVKGDKKLVTAPHVLGLRVPVLEHGEFSWQKVIRVTHVGPVEVAKISCGSNVYAAGDQQGRYILTHNVDEIKP